MLKGGEEGFLLRLRAEYSSAERSRARMNMQITVKDEDKVIVQKNLADYYSSSLWLELDLPVADYTVTYQFFEKELVKKAASSKSIEEDDVETGDSNCKLPYITQELVIMDKLLLKKRVREFDPLGLPDLSKNIEC